MYSQQFTLCYFLVKSPLFRIHFYNFLRHQSVSGAPPPKKNPGSASDHGQKRIIKELINKLLLNVLVFPFHFRYRTLPYI